MTRLTSTAFLYCIFAIVSFLRCGSTQNSTTVSPSASVTSPSNQTQTATTATPSSGVTPSSSSDSPYVSNSTTANNSVAAPTTSSNVTLASPSPTGAINETTVQSETSTVAVPTPSTASSVTPSTTAPVTSAAPTSSTKGTGIWDKAIDYVTPLGTFIIVIVAVALLLILLVALIYVCCKYRKLKKRTRFPHHVSINDTEWIRSNDDLLMWEQNLRAGEVKTTNGVTNRPYNEKRA